MQRFYFDHNATTPVAPEVLETLASCLGQVYGNASSIHHFGQGAKQRMEAARRQLASLIGCQPSSLDFTSGGTEADNPAVLGPCEQLEREGVEITRLRVSPDCLVDPEDVRRAMRPETVLVSVMHANNELGTFRPIAEPARIARAAGVTLHVDGVQALGKIPVDVEALGVDLYSMSAHKLYAPKGVGALYVRKGTAMAPIAFGGHHERDPRPGTENVPGGAAFGAAAELAARTLAAESERLAALRARRETAI